MSSSDKKRLKENQLTKSSESSLQNTQRRQRERRREQEREGGTEGVNRYCIHFTLVSCESRIKM